MVWHRRVLALWRDRHATGVAASVIVEKTMLADEPRLRGVVDGDLRRQVMEAPVPLGWRWTDARWALRSLGRAVIGHAPDPPPYDEKITVQIVSGDTGLFERNRARI